MIVTMSLSLALIWANLSMHCLVAHEVYQRVVKMMGGPPGDDIKWFVWLSFLLGWPLWLLTNYKEM